jgi:hypothetical protein
LDPRDPDASHGTSGMAIDWNPGEDMRPGAKLLRKQPEVTPRGNVWTQLTWFELNGAKCYTQLTIRECSDDYLIGHGRIWPVTDEDGA